MAEEQEYLESGLATSRPHEFLKTKDFSESLETDPRMMMMMRDPGNKVERYGVISPPKFIV